MNNNIDLPYKIEFDIENKYMRIFNIINSGVAYKNIKRYTNILVCVYISSVLSLLLKLFYKFDFKNLFNIIFDPFYSGTMSDLEKYVKPFLILYPLFMLIWSFRKINEQTQFEMLCSSKNIKQSIVELRESTIYYVVGEKCGEIKYVDINGCRKWKNYIIIESKNGANIVIPCDKTRTSSIFCYIKEKVKKELRKVTNDIREWTKSVYKISTSRKMLEIIMISIWVSFIYYYLVGVEYTKYNFITAFSIETKMYGISCHYHDLLGICVVLTIIIRIIMLINKSRIRREYKNAENNVESESKILL